MTLVTLHGAIPVYVQVDVEKKEVTYVCASDEEFFYVGERHDEPGVLPPTALVMSKESGRPLAYAANGMPFDNHDLIEKAHRIAENDPTEVGFDPARWPDWPAWSWGW